MAAAPHRNENPYEDDGGGYGKFRKRPFRRVSTTPYDRPLTAIRNPSHANSNNNNNGNGWLSKLMDPAQRLITSSAHKLFASVFRKRLPPPQQPPELDANGGVSSDRKQQQEAVRKDPPGVQGSVSNDIDCPASSSYRGGLTELERILKQKTFTRSEIDQLTALLQSRTVDLPAGTLEKKNEVIPSKGVLLLDRKEFPNTPVKDNGFDSRHISTPIVNSSVLDEDVASPAELAKAYMGSRPSKLSPSALGLRSQPLGDGAVTQIDRPSASKLPIMSIVPRSSSRAVPIINGFATPRSRGRSAIYSMARTPYSRVHAASTHQAAGTDAFGTPSSSSQSIWESSGFSGSKQGALKRRSSVFDNDIGSVGPIRRIRQKSNLLASSGTISVRGTGLGSDGVKHPSSQKQVLTSEPAIGNGDNSVRGSGITSVPSKSSEMASKILQQLDVLVSSRDKSPTKLSSSMLRGPALKSLENVDSSKFLEAVQDSNKLDVKHVRSLPEARDSMSEKRDKVEENGPIKISAINDKSASALNGVVSTSLVKNTASDVKTVSFGTNSVAQSATQKKRAFQMSAHEDYLELDDDDQSDTLPVEKEKLATSFAENKTTTAEAITFEKPATSLHAKLHGNSILNQTPPGASDGFAIAEKTRALTDHTASLPSVSLQQHMEDKKSTVISDKGSTPTESSAAPPIFSFGNNVVSPKEPNGFPPSNFSSKSEEKIPQLTFTSTSPVVTNSMSSQFDISSNPKSESSNSFAFGAADGTKNLTKEAESDKAADKNNLKAGVFFSSTETVPSAVSMPSTAANAFSFGLTHNASNAIGSLTSTPSFSSPSAALFSQNISGQNTISSSTNAAVNSSSNSVIAATTANIKNSSNPSLSASAPSFVSAPAFRFGSPVVPSTSTSLISASSGVESTEAKKNETSFGNLTNITSSGGSLFSSPSLGMKSTGSSVFCGTSSAVTSDGTSSAVTSVGTSSAVTSTCSSSFNFNAGANTSASATSHSHGFNPFNSASAQASAAGTVFSTSSLSMPIQFDSTVSSPFGFTANTAFSSGSSSFSSSSSTGNLFSSGATFGSSSSTLEVNPVSSTTTTTPVFGANWSTTKSPTFGSSCNSSSSSTGFVFGASSASNAVTSTASMTFGSSSVASSSSGPVFNFSSAGSATQLQPAFINPSHASPFGSSPCGNNDQMNMEDSMAEDTVQATSTVPVFGQQSTVPPSSGFIFGSTNPTGGNQFVSTPTVPPASNPFQFASQPNLAAPQNQPPFQASGSLEFNAGGSFSLGTGGDKSNRKFIRVNRKSQRKK